jgi:predicted dehydrogenase
MSIRLGIVGFGLRSSSLIAGWAKDPLLDFCVAGIVDPNEAGARDRLVERDKKDAKFYGSLDEMVRHGRLDGLMIGTRCHMHADIAAQAAKYDIPLFLEKPVAINMDQALSLEKAFTNSRCRVIVSFPLRVSPLCRLARQLIEEGAVGSPQHVHAVNYVAYGAVYWQEEYRNYAITQGLFLQKATHDLDYISYLMGSPIVRIGAMANFGKVMGGQKPSGLKCSECAEQASCNESPRNRAKSGTAFPQDHPCVFSVDCGNAQTGTNEDCSSALFEFANGSHGVYSQVFFARRDAAARGAIVSGYDGTVSFDWYKNQVTHVRHHQPFTDTIKAGEGMAHFGGDTELAFAFEGLIKGSGEGPCPIAVGLQSVYACLGAKESVRTGQFVKVRQVQL